MNKLILTFFIIVLILLLIKNKIEKFSTRGCSIRNPARPREDEIYRCFLNNIDSWNSTLKSRSTGTRVNLVKKLGHSIRDYFKQLYKYGLEREYRAIIVFVPATYRENKPVEVITNNIRMKHFMTSANDYNMGKYEIHSNARGNDNQKFNFIRTINVRNKRIKQVNGILIGMGFKFAISSRPNNKKGRKCSFVEMKSSYSFGPCIPMNFLRFDAYLPGGRYVNYAEIERRSKNRYLAGGNKLHWYHPRAWYPRGRVSQRSTLGCGGSRPEQSDWQYQKSLDRCMGSCYLRSRDSCHTAYGDSRIAEIYVIPDFNFFNTFYTNSKKAEFAANNYSSLNRYH